MESTTKSTIVEAPLSVVYNQYTQFEQFPQFMQGIKSVQQLDDTTLQWTAEIAGKETSWTAKIIEQVPDSVIAWQSISGKPNNGRVQFSANGPDQTLVEATLHYEPEGVIENVGDALGMVGSKLEGDLLRFKQFVERRGRETGGWRGEIHQGQKVGSTS